MSITKKLQRQLGGVWRYDRALKWWMRDDWSHVVRVPAGQPDENGAPLKEAGYWLYEPGSPSRRIYL